MMTPQEHFEGAKDYALKYICQDTQNKAEQKQLDRAVEIIKGLLESCFGYNSKSVNYEIKTRAEKFLKEIDK